MDRAVTMRQVADAAGVSPATVSRALSGSQQVDPELRARVVASAQRLGYRTNRVARALRTRSTGTVGMVVPNITNPFFPVVIQAVEHELRQHNVRLLLCDSADDVGQEAELLRILLDHRIDGILISACDRIASRSAIRMAAGLVPVVQVDRVAVADLHFVGVDQHAAMAAVVDHLVDLGCRRFAYVSSSTHISTSMERLRSYARLVRAVDEPSAGRTYIGDFSLEWGREAARRICDEHDLPDAIVCANDLVAAGVLQVMEERGTAVPGEVVVTGFDDTVLATVSRPQLTTIRQPLAEIGREAVEAVLSAGPRSPVNGSLLSAELVVRESTNLGSASKVRVTPGT
ncbi:MAG: LacI family DNA-binding transcriptional regulator [Acidimicrobiales bacterium]